MTLTQQWLWPVPCLFVGLAHMNSFNPEARLKEKVSEKNRTVLSLGHLTPPALPGNTNMRMYRRAHTLTQHMHLHTGTHTNSQAYAFTHMHTHRHMHLHTCTDGTVLCTGERDHIFQPAVLFSGPAIAGTWTVLRDVTRMCPSRTPLWWTLLSCLPSYSWPCLWCPSAMWDAQFCRKSQDNLLKTDNQFLTCGHYSGQHGGLTGQAQMDGH